uniref:coiled-coil domain-containing protein 112 n=1 Tax=Doryrhamphus excisus TaxID=161450 RepID=UPI0025AE4795|nr:coiled-coil domain-containing protein 112 [Doryrhamphus excisus]
MASLATERQHHTQGDSETPSLPDSRDGVDERQSRKKAIQFFKEVQKTRMLVDKLERERMLSIQCRKNGWTDVATELEKYEKTLIAQRSAQKMHLQKQLVKIQNGVREFKKQLIDMKPTPTLIEKLKEIMSQVEISISNLKEEQRSCFGELLKEERTCAQEVTAYEKKIENWSRSTKSDSKLSAVPTVKSKSLDRDLPLEVRALEAFLQKTGGVCGGWEEYDHQVFLKVWTKHRGQASFRKEAKVFLPGKSQEDIEEHERWHQEVIHLQNKRREAIQRWKSRKEVERQTRIQKLAEMEEAERKKKSSKFQQSKTEEEKKLAAQRLEEWKEAKRRKEEQEEEKIRAERVQKNRIAKVERRRHLEAKMTSETSAEEEDEKIRREEKEKEVEKRRKEATKGIRHLIKRDLDRVQAKRQEKLQKQKEEEERQERIMMKLKEKVDSHIGRDPSRLVKPTKGWEERLKSAGSSGGGQVHQMFHRAVPSWRQGL